jgi:solute:Na+ symporter, SSS family
MSTEMTVLIGVCIYLVLMLVIGIAVARRVGSQEEFLVAGRKLPIWLLSATIIATWFGGGTMLGASGAGYEGGFLAAIADPFGASLVMVLVGLFFVRTFRRMKLLTIVQFFEGRFGKTAGLVASIGLLLSNIGWTGALLVAFGYVFQTLTGIPMEMGILGGAIIVLSYTTLGGMWAVVLTDFVQVVILAFGLVLLLVIVLIDVGGWSAIAPQLPEHTFRMIPLENTSEKWLNYMRLWFIFGLADLSAQTLMQRVFAAKDEQVAQNSFYLAGAGYLFLGLIPVTLGIIASVTMPGITDPETVIAKMAIAHLHPVAIAIFVGAMLAAIMSSADSALLATASIISVNIAPYFKRNITAKQELLVTRIAIPASGAIALYVALEVQQVLDLMFDANSVMLASVIVPFITGVWWKKANNTGCLAAMVAGFVVWVSTGWFYPNLPGDVLGFFFAFFTIVVVTNLSQSFDPPKVLVDTDGEPIDLKNRLGIMPLFRRVKAG